MFADSSVQIGERSVGQGQPAYVIAEIGSNHNQSLALAKEMIEAAQEAGADAAKFQSLKFEQLYLPDRTQGDFREFFRQIELSESWYEELASHCRKRGIHFLSSPTYMEAVDLLSAQGVPAYKIASAQFGVFPELVAHAASQGLPMLMSTGIADYGDIQDMLALCRSQGNNNLVLLHCVSQYPTEMGRANLRLIETYRRMFGCLVGYSDHTPGIHVAPTAVALGAVVVEKHLTLDRSLPGPDHHFAVEPDEFRQMVQHIRDIEAALGSGVRGGLEPDERAFREEVSFKWITRRAIPKGERLERQALDVRRCTGGISREMMAHLLNHEAKVNLPAGALLEWRDLNYVG